MGVITPTVFSAMTRARPLTRLPATRIRAESSSRRCTSRGRRSTTPSTRSASWPRAGASRFSASSTPLRHTSPRRATPCRRRSTRATTFSTSSRWIIAPTTASASRSARSTRSAASTPRRIAVSPTPTSLRWTPRARRRALPAAPSLACRSKAPRSVLLTTAAKSKSPRSTRSGTSGSRFGCSPREDGASRRGTPPRCSSSTRSMRSSRSCSVWCTSRCAATRPRSRIARAFYFSWR
mmetsp:Transcript_9043/g.37227  ORF Transcript_9043/g.37227 Transcript_9043/m.37227 type:complete len:237 (-) Transcript_9043:859-1569(-)